MVLGGRRGTQLIPFTFSKESKITSSSKQPMVQRRNCNKIVNILYIANSGSSVYQTMAFCVGKKRKSYNR